MKAKIIFTLSLTLIWLLLLGIPNSKWEAIILATVIMLVLYMSHIFLLVPNRINFKLSAFKYIFWLWKEMLLSSIVVIKLCWSKNPIMHTALSTVKSIQKSDLGISIYANSITLTPGTVTLLTQGNKLLIHAISQSLLDDLQNQEMDKKIQSILS